MSNKFFNKIIIFLIIVFSLLTATYKAAGIYAQEEAQTSGSAFDQSYKTYLTELQEYESAHTEFVTKKANYQRFKTLQSQEEAQAATVRMMTERDELIIAYLATLRERMDEAIGVDETRKANLHIRIAAEIAWFTDHKDKIPTAGSLKDLEEDNKRASQRYPTAEALFYEILATISDGRISDYRERMADTFSEVKTKIAEIRIEEREEYRLSGRQLSQLDRWILDTENKLLRAGEKQEEARKIIDTLGNAAQRKQQPLTIYNNVISTLNQSKQQLKEGGTYIVEILRLIKSKD